MLKQISIENAAEVDYIFSMLMGEDVGPRREFNAYLFQHTVFGVHGRAPQLFRVHFTQTFVSLCVDHDALLPLLPAGNPQRVLVYCHSATLSLQKRQSGGISHQHGEDVVYFSSILNAYLFQHTVFGVHGRAPQPNNVKNLSTLMVVVQKVPYTHNDTKVWVK